MAILSPNLFKQEGAHRQTDKRTDRCYQIYHLPASLRLLGRVKWTLCNMFSQYSENVPTNRIGKGHFGPLNRPNAKYLIRPSRGSKYWNFKFGSSAKHLSITQNMIFNPSCMDFQCPAGKGESVRPKPMCN